MHRTVGAVAVAWTVWVGATERLAAQPLSPFYAGGGVGTFSVSADAVSGHAMAASGTVGASLASWLDVEAEVVVPGGAFNRSYGGDDTLSLSFAGPGASSAERERLGVWLRYDTRRQVAATLSAVAVFHVPLTRRGSLGLVAGVGAARVHDERRYTPVRLGEGVDPDHPAARARLEAETRMIGGPTIGARVAWRVADHVTVAPDVRVDYGSIGDEINNAVRTSVKVLWRF